MCVVGLLATQLIQEVIHLDIHLKEIGAAAGLILLIIVVDADRTHLTHVVDHILHTTSVEGLIPALVLGHTAGLL